MGSSLRQSYFIGIRVIPADNIVPKVNLLGDKHRYLHQQKETDEGKHAAHYCAISSIEVILHSPRLVDATRRGITDRPRIWRSRPPSGDNKTSPPSFKVNQRRDNNTDRTIALLIISSSAFRTPGGQLLAKACVSKERIMTYEPSR